MANNKTNCTINGKDYFRIRRKVGKRLDKNGLWVDDYKAFYGVNKKDAERLYQEYMADQAAAKGTGHLGEEIESWIQSTFIPDPRIKDSTKQNYIRAYNKNLKGTKIAGRQIRDLTGKDLQVALDQLPCAQTTKKYCLNLLRRFFAYEAQNGLCNDITGTVIVAPPKQKRKATDPIEVWTDAEIKTILKKSKGHRLHFLIVLALNTGARLSELLALRYSDISNGDLHITKQISSVAIYDGSEIVGRVQEETDPKSRDSVRIIPLSQSVLDALEEHKAWQKSDMEEKNYTTDYIFATSAGTPYDKHNVNTYLRRLYDDIGIPRKGFHTYRHTFGTRLARTAPMHVVAEILGHSDISVTAKYYVSVSTDEKKAAIDGLKYD